MYQEFLHEVEDLNPQLGTPLAKYTTWRIGGNAEILIVSNNSAELEKAVLAAAKHGIEITILGNGSNILISDNGIKGLTIVNKSKNIELGKKVSKEDLKNPTITHRHSESGDKNYYSFSDLDYEETADGQEVTFDSGVMLPYAINWTLKQGLTGLQWFAGIPGSMGGSLYNNIHGGTKHFSECFKSAKIVNEQNLVQTLLPDFFNFGYDQSILRENKNIVILNVTLNLIFGDLKRATYTAKEWLKRKSIQPKISCGSVFQALPEDVQKKLGYPTPSIGYIIDKILGWKGKKIGDIQISPTHANFMVNTGQAKASETLQLIKEVRKEVFEKTGYKIQPEINFLGFTEEELDGVRN